jgi:hypothetical protein
MLSAEPLDSRIRREQESSYRKRGVQALMIFYNTYNLFVNLAVNQGSSIQIEEETGPFFKLQSHLRPLILALLAKPEYLLWLSENDKYAPLVGSLALHLDAFLMMPKYGSPYVIAGDRLHRLQKRGARR